MATNSVSFTHLGSSKLAGDFPGRGVATKEHLNRLLSQVDIPGGNSVLSNIAASSAFLVGDYMTGYRAGQDLLTSHLALKGGEIPDVLLSPELGVAYQAFGLATGVYAMTGVAKFFNASAQVARAKAIGDETGVLLGRVGQANSMILTSAGTTFATFRGLAVADAAMGVEVSKSAPTLIGRVTNGLKVAGLFLFSVFYVILTAITGWQIKKGSDFQKALDKALTLANKVEFLQKQLQADPTSIQSDLLEKHKEALKGKVDEGDLLQKAKEAALQELIDEGYEAGKVGLKKQMAQLGLEAVSDQRLKEMLDQMVSATMTGPSKLIGEKVEMVIANYALNRRVFKKVATSNASLQRLMTQAGIGAIQEAASLPSLVGGVTKGGSEAIQNAKRLVNTVETAVMDQRKLNIKLIVACFVNLGALALFLTPGVGWGLLLAASILMLISTVMMLYLDGKGYLDAVNGSRPGDWDKAHLIFSTGLALTSGALSFGLMAAGVVSFGVIPAVVSAVLLAMWLGQNAHTWKKIGERELEYRKFHPTLEFLTAAIEGKEKPEAIFAMLARLAPEQRKIIEDHLHVKSKDLQELFDRLKREGADVVISRYEKKTKEALVKELVEVGLYPAAQLAMKEMEALDKKELKEIRERFVQFFEMGKEEEVSSGKVVSLTSEKREDSLFTMGNFTRGAACIALGFFSAKAAGWI